MYRIVSMQMNMTLLVCIEMERQGALTMVGVHVGEWYEYFNSIEEIITYLRNEDNYKYKMIGEAMVELLKGHDNDLQAKFFEERQEEINDLEAEINELNSCIVSAIDEIERCNDDLDYCDEDMVEIATVKNYLQKIDLELR